MAEPQDSGVAFRSVVGPAGASSMTIPGVPFSSSVPARPWRLSA